MDRRLVPASVADGLGMLRFRMPGEILIWGSPRAFDELCSQVHPHPETFLKQNQQLGIVLHRCCGGHYLIKAEDAERCCNGWSQVRYVRRIGEDKLDFGYKLVCDSDHETIDYWRRFEQAAIEFLRLKRTDSPMA